MISVGLKPITSIYVGSKDVCLVQFKKTLLRPQLVKFGKTEIQASAQQATEPTTEQSQAIVQAIKKVIQENNIKTKKVITALPGKDVLIRYFQIPRIPKPEWETAVKFEAKKYIPFKIEELMWDFHIAAPKSSRLDVTFVAVKEEVGQRHLSFLEEAGLEVSVLEPAPFSLLRLFTVSNQLAKGKPTAILDLDYGMADINIVKDRICYLTRDASIPLEEELIFESLLNEIRMSLDYYEKLFPAEVVAKVLLCGAMELKDWGAKLAKELKMPVEEVKLARVIKTQKVSPPLTMAVAIGLGLRGLTRAAAEVNLYQIRAVAPETPLAKAIFVFTPAMRQAIFRAVALSCIALLSLHLVMYQPIIQKKKKLNLIKSLRPKTSLPVDSLSQANLEETTKKIRNKIAALDAIIGQRIFWTDKLNQLPTLIPPGVWLTNLSFEERVTKDNSAQRSLTLRGVAYHENPAQGIEVITAFVSRLKEDREFSRGFKEIKLKAMTSGELEGMPVKDFSISCSL